LRFSRRTLCAHPEGEMAADSAQTKFVAAQVVSLRTDSNFDERWLEKQITEQPVVLGLGNIAVLHSQLIHKDGGRLDLLAEDKENQYRYTIELMLGKLDKSHIVRTIDYWLRERARLKEDEWQTVAVVVAEDIRNSRYFNVVKFLTEKMPMVVVEMRALKVGKNLTVTCSTLLDGRDETADEDIEEPSAPKDRAAWLSKSSPASVEVVDEIGKLLKTIDPIVSINWANRRSVGLQVGNRSANFVTFAPKKKFVRVSARFLEDSEKWMNKLQKAGFHIVGGTPGKSVRFRATKREVVANKKLLIQVFTEGYNTRMGKDSD
jgi:hypothetical protein